MSVALAKQKQGLLFSEPSIAETGVWCKLEEGIDPKFALHNGGRS